MTAATRYLRATIRFAVLAATGLLCLVLIIAWHLSPADYFLARGDR